MPEIEAPADADGLVNSSGNPSPIAYFYRGRGHDAMGRSELAIQDYDEAIRLNPQYGHVYIVRGRLYHDLGQYERAIQDFDEVIRFSPQYSMAYYWRGGTYVTLGEYTLAIQDYGEAIHWAIQDWGEERVHLKSWWQPDVTDRYPFSLAYINRAAAHINLGAARKARGERGWQNEYVRAGQNYGKVIRLEPRNAFAYYGRGFTLHSLGGYELAIQDYGEAIRLNPRFTRAYEDRGEAYQAIGKSTEAERDFAKAKELGG
jgi:tetratricopeptide (TPR) repeat protein